MRFIFLAFAATLLLSGCSDADWDHVMTFGGAPAQEDAAPAAPQAVAAAPVMATDPSFCQAVAKQDATDNAFDPATQQRMARQSYAQCIATYSK